MTIDDVRNLLKRIDASLFLTDFEWIVEHDKKYSRKIPVGGWQGNAGMNLRTNGRVYIQIKYNAPCSKTGEIKEWRGRKWYLSSHMLEQEIIFTAYTAFKMAVEHEIMEGFKVDGIILINPHVNYKRLLEISNDEIEREKVSQLL